METKHKRATHKKMAARHLKIIILVIIGIVVGLILSVAIYNYLERQKEVLYEITFTSPHQAVVFWKTDHPTIGYIKYGPNINDRSMKEYQTSSVESETHAVVLNDIPLEGLAISIHNETDNT